MDLRGRGVTVRTAAPGVALLLVQDAEGGSAARDLLGNVSVEPTEWIRALVLLFVGLPLAFALAKWIRSWVTRTTTPQRGLVVGKLFWYSGVAGIVVTVLLELGFNLAPLLGAAGILGIALGFASQTSVSNVISGFFLMAEQPFVVDDIIEVGSTVGRVLSIDMMSVKIRTFDNRFVRIPNEQIIKSEVTTVTRFPVRRVEVSVGVAYKEDMGRVRKILLEVAEANPRCLIEPAPVVVFKGYGESSLDFLLGAWAAREHWLELKNTIHEDIKKRFDQEGIEIPFPHRTLYAGAETAPIPVRMVADEPDEAS